MKKHMTQEVAIKSAWMILEGLGYDRARNGDLEKTVTAVYESAPAADVVEVVRCGQCKYCVEHYDTDGNAPYWTCKEWDSGTDYDGYCHYGERKEGGHDDGT